MDAETKTKTLQEFTPTDPIDRRVDQGVGSYSFIRSRINTDNSPLPPSQGAVRDIDLDDKRTNRQKIIDTVSSESLRKLLIIGLEATERREEREATEQIASDSSNDSPDFGQQRLF